MGHASSPNCLHSLHCSTNYYEYPWATLEEGKSNPDPNVIVNKFDSLFINRRFLESSQNCLPPTASGVTSKINVEVIWNIFISKTEDTRQNKII